jgi:hypothetical protein
MKNYHLLPDGRRWKLLTGVTGLTIHTFQSRSEAVAISSRLVKQNGGALKIHNADGTLQEVRTWSQPAAENEARPLASAPASAAARIIPLPLVPPRETLLLTAARSA